jgi:hypothetical protein
MRPATRRLGLPVALVSLVLLGAACSPAGSKPSSSAAPAPQEMVSTRYGFRLTLTKTWTAADATVDWDGGVVKGLGEPGLARFADATTGRTLVGAATSIRAGTPLVAWRTAAARTMLYDCNNARSAKRTTLDGEPAMTWPAFCPDELDVVSVAAVHGSRGYVLSLASPTQGGIAADQAVLESIRRSFRFER